VIGRLKHPSKIRAFNYDTISDVLLTISYTASEGDSEAAETRLVSMLTSSAGDENTNKRSP
jgi:hypothetical protein